MQCSINAGHTCCNPALYMWGNNTKGLPMAQSAKLQIFNTLPGGKPLFGPGPAPQRSAESADRSQIGKGPNKSLADQLNERLMEKYRGYERAAARLELRGEHDAAKVLRQAASKARLLRNGAAEIGAA